LQGRLIDGTGADPLADAVLVIQGNRIVAVGPRAQVFLPPNAQIIDLPQATILPGFINTHVHNAYNARNLQIWAQDGVTTVRDLGHRLGRPYFAIRDRLRADPRNARLIAAGPLVTVPEGYPIAGNNFPSLTVTSVEDAREKIGQLIDEGADVIKITLTSGRAPSLSLEEAAAIVETAHERGIPVTAHATTAKDLGRALEAGVDDVAHIAVDRVSNKVIRRMVEADISWVPTFEPLENRGQDNLSRFIKAGGRVALGNDGGYLPGIEVGMPLREIQAMHEAGMTSMQIIVAATRDAAYVCRRADLLGTLEVGKAADILVVKGDPLRDLQVLQDAQLVIHDGVIIRNEGLTILSDGGDAVSASPTSPAYSLGNTRIRPADGMTMIYVPGGELRMGGTWRLQDRVHTVALYSSLNDLSEVTKPGQRGRTNGSSAAGVGSTAMGTGSFGRTTATPLTQARTTTSSGFAVWFRRHSKQTSTGSMHPCCLCSTVPKRMPGVRR
jgi:imidazolonepropionase-like amidohydrolase